MADTTNRNVQFTQVISPVSDTGTSTSNNFSPKGARRLINESDVSTQPVMFTVDSSMDFRRKLEYTDKRYKRLKLMATGGYGRVFLVEDNVLGRKAVVKSLKEELLDNPDIVRKFLTEAKLNAQLDHPSIVTVFSLDTDSSDGLHLAMQLINGITLKEYLARTLEEHQKNNWSNAQVTRLLQERLEIFLHICDAIDYSHSKGIIHCDIKPDNVMIGRYGEVYVMDWGIAAADGCNRKANLDGTPSYMPPETLRDGITNKQTDVFALGMLLNEVVTLRPPIQGDTPLEIAKRIFSGDYEPSTSILPGKKIPDALQAIIEKARDGDPEERYKKVKTMADDIRHFLFNEEVVEAYPDTWLMKLSRFMYNYRVATAIVVMGLILCMSGLLVMHLYASIKEGRERSLEVNERNNMYRINEDFSRIFTLAQALGENLSMALGTEYARPSVEADDVLFYVNDDYAPTSSNQPENMQMTKFFKNKVSFDYGTYFKPEGFSEQAFLAWVQRFKSLHAMHASNYLSNVTMNEEKVSSRKDDMQAFVKHGPLLRRFTYILDNGLVFRFPGTYEEGVYDESDFMDDGIQQRMNKPDSLGKFLWTLPHPDPEGHVVISCWLPILDISGEKLGLICLDICYHKLIEGIEEQAKKEAYQAEYYLVDNRGNVIFKSDKNRVVDDNIHVTKFDVVKFEYPQILNKIRSTVHSQFKIREKNKALRVAWSRLKNTDWLIIRIMPEGKFTWVDTLDSAETNESYNKADDSYGK